MQNELRQRIKQHAWLKAHRLHKYTSLLVGMPRAQVLALDDASLIERGVTAGATKKLLTSIRGDINTLPWLDPGDTRDPRATISSPTPKSTFRLSAQPILEDDVDASLHGRMTCARCGGGDHAIAQCQQEARSNPYAPRLDFREVVGPK